MDAMKKNFEKSDFIFKRTISKTFNFEIFIIKLLQSKTASGKVTVDFGTKR